MLTRWDPFAEIARLQDQMARWTGTRDPSLFGETFSPPVDIFEEQDAIVLKAELPGLKADNVQITIENDVLTISGERKLERESTREGYRRVERAYGSFTRSFALPKTVDNERVEAETVDGVLTVRIPKKAAAEPKRIDVKGAGGERSREASAGERRVHIVAGGASDISSGGETSGKSAAPTATAGATEKPMPSEK